MSGTRIEEEHGAAGGNHVTLLDARLFRALDFEIKSLFLKDTKFLISGQVRDNDPIVLAERCQPDYESRALSSYHGVIPKDSRLGHCGMDSDDRNMI